MVFLTWSFTEQHFTIHYLPAQITSASEALSNYCFRESKAVKKHLEIPKGYLEANLKGDNA